MVSLSGQAQTELSYNSGNAQFQKVLDVPGKSAADLYALATRWVATTFNNPDAATWSKIDGEMVRGQGFDGSGAKLALGVRADARYAWQVDVKDSKVRFTVSDMRIITTSGTFPFEAYVFKKDGSERVNGQATNIKDSFSNIANSLYLSLERTIADPKKGDDW